MVYKRREIVGDMGEASGGGKTNKGHIEIGGHFENSLTVFSSIRLPLEKMEPSASSIVSPNSDPLPDSDTVRYPIVNPKSFSRYQTMHLVLGGLSKHHSRFMWRSFL